MAKNSTEEFLEGSIRYVKLPLPAKNITATKNKSAATFKMKKNKETNPAAFQLLKFTRVITIISRMANIFTPIFSRIKNLPTKGIDKQIDSSISF